MSRRPGSPSAFIRSTTTTSTVTTGSSLTTSTAGSSRFPDHYRRRPADRSDRSDSRARSLSRSRSRPTTPLRRPSHSRHIRDAAISASLGIDDPFPYDDGGEDDDEHGDEYGDGGGGGGGDHYEYHDHNNDHGYSDDDAYDHDHDNSDTTDPANENPLATLLPLLTSLAAETATLDENMADLAVLHDSINRFNHSFGSFLYGMNMNAFCVDFPEAPIDESFARGRTRWKDRDEADAVERAKIVSSTGGGGGGVEGVGIHAGFGDTSFM